jgi:hypothetical protein
MRGESRVRLFNESSFDNFRHRMLLVRCLFLDCGQNIASNYERRFATSGKLLDIEVASV